MTVQEAIKAMGFYKQKLFNGIFNQYIEAFDVAKQALEKQIPKKVVKIHIPNTSFCKSHNREICPTCRNAYEGTDYCPICGQRLLWEEGGTSD